VQGEECFITRQSLDLEGTVPISFVGCQIVLSISIAHDVSEACGNCVWCLSILITFKAPIGFAPPIPLSRQG
jgi:hypothetical protein